VLLSLLKKLFIYYKSSPSIVLVIFISGMTFATLKSFMSILLLILTPISKIFFKNKKKQKKNNQKSVFNTFKPFTHPFILLTSLKNIQSIKKNDKIRNNIKKEDWWVKRKTKKKEPK
jgi:glucan phosphoethanolaminetransferase (alkaline phosphatase superfamily)